MIYWISNPIWIGGSLTIVSFAAIEEFFGPVGGAWKYVYAVAFIWFTIGAAIVSLRYGKWVPTLGAWARGAVLTFFVVSVAIFAARHGVHGFGGHAFLPTYAVFIAVVPVLFFNYAGLEVPTAAGEEMTNPSVTCRSRCSGRAPRRCWPTGSPSWPSSSCCRPARCPG